MTQRAYRIRWKKRSQICKSSMIFLRNVVNEYMKTRVREVVGDKGYHGNDILVELVEQEYRSGQFRIASSEVARKWKDKQAEQAATYAIPTSHSRDSR